MRIKLLRKLRRRYVPTPLYQSKRTLGTEQRWQMIGAQLDENDRSLLDIGCNLGIFTRQAAERGLLALGLDRLPRAVAKATRQNENVDGLAFMQFELTPDTLAKLPAFDVVMCLSVFHYWIAAYGEATAWLMIRRLIKKTQRKFFFEPASIRKKYGLNAPEGMNDLDRDWLVRYHLERLTEAAGSDRQATYLGETACLGPETFRLMFLVSKV